MMRQHQLDDFAQRLVTTGVCASARADSYRGEAGVMIWPEPPCSTSLFFPLWELNKPGTMQLILDRNFSDVLAKRPPGFDPTRRF